MIKYSVAILLLLTTLNSIGMPSSYYKIKDSKAMKEQFFTYMSKIVYTQNRYILMDRKFIKKFWYKKNTTIKIDKEYKRFLEITKRYKLNIKDSLSKYLYHIDIIPASLVLAQAAVESAWGKSRFMIEGNNVFGQWTWSGKGIIPQNRDIGKKHKVKIFNSIDAAVRGYMININIGWGYKDLRDLRVKIRKYGASLSGLSLSRTLLNYSQKREEYTRLLAIIIIRNHLERFNIDCIE